MSFKVNSSQQISFNDSVFSLTAREKKALDNSWAKIFADEIFPNIDEERFSVLYSSNLFYAGLLLQRKDAQKDIHIAY